MRAAAALFLCAAVAAVAGSGAANAADVGFRVVTPGTALFPDRTYVIALDQPRRLAPDDVFVTENGRPVVGAVVQSAEGASGIGTVLLIDTSNSMRPVIANAMAAARAFAARNEGQPLAVVGFNSTPQVLLPFTTSRATVVRALARTPRLAEGTHIFDALTAAVAQIRDAGLGAGRIVLVSDGDDVGSQTRLDSALSQLRAENIRAFTVGVRSPAFTADDLRRIAEATGGTFAEAGSSELRRVYDELGFRLSKEYLVRYRSPAGAGESVEVTIGIGNVIRSTSYLTPETGTGGPYEKALVDRIIQSWLLVPLVVFFVVGLLAYAFQTLLHVRTTRRFRLRLGDYVELEQEERARRRRREVAELLALAPERSSATTGLLRSYADDLAVSGIGVALPVLLFWSGFAGFILALLAGVLAGTPAALLGVLPPIVVRLEVKRRASATRKLFGNQLPDNLEVMASALRAGQSLAGSMASVVAESQDPSRTEFRRVVTDEQLGVPLDEALEVAARRMENPDMHQVAVVAMLQREAGGNMAEVLDQVIVNVRARMELQRLVNVLTAQGRLSRWVITMIPIVLMALIALLSPSYLTPLFHEPTGRLALVFASVCIVLGFYVISRIASLKA